MEKLNKKQLIEDFLNTPYKVGESVIVRGLGIHDKKAWGNSTEILEISEDGLGVYIKNYDGKKFVAFEDIKKRTTNIGYNPFPKKRDKLRISTYSLDSILHFTNPKKKEIISGLETPEADYNPFVIINGERIYYQRPLVWDLEAKQNLIKSIILGLNCGLVVIRKRSWEDVEKLAKKGIVSAFFDIVDGKQRLSTLHEFVNDGFQDSEGYYFSEWSDSAQSQLKRGQHISFGELDEDTTDEETIEQFLRVNFTGVPQSTEHINYVMSIADKFQK